MEAKEAAKSRYGTTLEKCDKMIDHALAHNPKVQFLRESLEKAGCRVGRKFFKSEICGRARVGGYDMQKGIIVCSNYVLHQDEVDETVIHELIHAYDQCRAANLDWTNCAHHACSEIRAGNLSGDCHFKRELLRGYFNLCKHHQDCVRRRSSKSVALNPFCTGTNIQGSIDEVWDTCYKDTKPFDKVP